MAKSAKRRTQVASTPPTSLTIEHVIKELLPFGTNSVEPGHPHADPDWSVVPLWAPDAFAVVATLAERSGLYAEAGIALSTTAKGRTEKRARAKEAEELGQEWGDAGWPPKAIQRLWTALWRARGQPVCDGAGRGAAWKAIAMRLLATTDEACAGVGYDLTPSPSPGFGTAELVFEEYRAAAPSTPALITAAAFLPYLPNSVARAVPADRACVLPKALTPSVGCTLRSATHNLALLPGRGQVSAEWRLTGSFTGASESEREDQGPFNLLLVPYPYEILGTDLPVRRAPDGSDVDGYFTVHPGWLPPGSDAQRVKAIVAFITALIAEAETDGGAVHAVILPETALTDAIVARVARGVARACQSLELFISGIITDASKAKRATGEPPFGKNEVFVARFEKGVSLDDYRQAKHHRWRLDTAQITRYCLGHTLSTQRSWWEAIDLADRRMVFGLDSRQAVIAALVCEDLARYDPVLPVLASVGPNLIVALLMDGPQLTGRWPGRHATVLADDPGSAVLTLTSLGLVRRSVPPKGVTPRNCIALWTERGGAPQELDLAPSAHALVLSLHAHPQKQNTLDLRRRRDSGGLIEYRLCGHRSVTLPQASPFSWLDRCPSGVSVVQATRIE